MSGVGFRIIIHCGENVDYLWLLFFLTVGSQQREIAELFMVCVWCVLFFFSYIFKATKQKKTYSKLNKGQTQGQYTGAVVSCSRLERQKERERQREGVRETERERERDGLQSGLEL